MSGDGPRRDVVRTAAAPMVDPTVEWVFEDGWVTFRNFRGTKRRLRIGPGRREIATLHRSPSYSSFGGDVVFTNAANRGVMQTRDWGIPHGALARAARAHGIDVDASLARYTRTKRPIRGWWWTPRLWNLRPHWLLYLRAAFILSVPAFMVGLFVSPGFAIGCVVAVCVLTAVKLPIDKLRFDRYVAKHGISLEEE